MNVDKGILRIKNISGAPYSFEELGGHTIQDQETVDLMDTSLPAFYDDWIAAWSAAKELSTTKLYQDIQAGDLEIVEWKAPMNVGVP